MTFKGTYSAATSYSVGDVVIYSNGNVYHLRKAAPAGTPPVDTRYWGELSQFLSEAVKYAADAAAMCLHASDIANNLTTDSATKALSAAQGRNLKLSIDTINGILNESAVILKSSTPDSNKRFQITVDDNGELSAEEVVE